ncbi:hypothetical protein UL70_14325, partial [Shigella sonnei]
MLKKILLLALLPAIAFAEELPSPVKAIEKQGITIIKTFDAPGGMKGYLGKWICPYISRHLLSLNPLQA